MMSTARGAAFRPVTPMGMSRPMSAHERALAMRTLARQSPVLSPSPWPADEAGDTMLGGGSLTTLREILGHSTVKVTERYAHLRADLFQPSDLLTLTVDLTRPTGALIDLAAHRGSAPANHATITLPKGAGKKERASIENPS
jgi:hypothetical protein